MIKYILTIEKKTNVISASLMIFGFWKRIFTEFLKIVLNIVLLDEIKCLFLGESFCNFLDRMIDERKE